jgi:glutamate racemase
VKPVSLVPPIGIFDSGVGGLTVLQELKRKLPAVPTVYFGDTAHLPYGSKSVDELIHFADVITGFLVEQGSGVIVDACNSTSSVALDFLKKKYPLPIIGVVEPGVDAALKITRNRKVGLIATEATVKSGAHCRLIASLDPAIEVFSQACPLFVPLVEAGEIDTPAVYRAAREYLAPLQAAGVDTLILGCTHYPFLLPVIGEILGPRVALVDPAQETVNQVKPFYPDGFVAGEVQPSYQFYASGPAGNFQEASQLLGIAVTGVRQIQLPFKGCS